MNIKNKIKERFENPLTFKQSFIVVLVFHILIIFGISYSSVSKSYAKEDKAFLNTPEGKYIGVPDPTPEPLKKEVLPDGKIATYSKPIEEIKPQPKKVNPKYTQTYTIKKGDTIHSISKRYGLNTKKLLDINHIKNPNNIREGQVLKFL
jgi:LysM repeat protein